jgi:hypothetical protein
VEEFKTLPVDLQTQLQSAAAMLDIEQTEQVIAQIPAQNDTIAAGLQQYLQQMDFQAILNLCKSA